MRWSKRLLALAAFALLGSVAIPRHVPEPFRPDVFAILLVFAAIRAPRREVFLLCWLTGLAKDLLAGGPPGGYALLYAAAAYAILRARRLANSNIAPVQGGLGFLAALGTESLYCAAACMQARTLPASGDLRTLLTTALLTGLLTPGCVWLLDRIAGRPGLQREYHFGSG